jgi:orotate phosphoribosyltransferase-like protein
MNSHYIEETMSIQHGLIFGANAADFIMEDAKGKPPALLYSGMSGVSLATFVGTQLRNLHGITPAMYYIRKPEEMSHGEIVEYSDVYGNEVNHRLYIVDDFIYKGETAKRIIRTLRNEGYFKHLRKRRITLVMAETSRRCNNCEHLGFRHAFFGKDTSITI